MNINTVDLTLFLVFQAIYATRSVTMAGDRMGRLNLQPAMR
jgi:hypothetical protein